MSSSQSRSKWRILIVDSQPEWVKFSKSVLEQAGYIVSTAEHAKSANRFPKEQSFDLILMNLKQAEEEQDLVRKRTGPGYNKGRIVIMVPIQLCPSVMRIGFKLLGADDCIDKPFNSHELIEVVERGLDESR